MVAPIQVTLGPLARNVINEETFKTKTPEIIDNGGIIARRILELPDRDADMGAMIVRHLVWRLHKTVGDCTATAATIFQAAFDEGLKAISAGIDPMGLRRYLDAGARIVDCALAEMVISVEGKEQLSQIAESICHDPPLAKLLGEIFDIIGEHGQLEIRKASGRELSREYVDGAYWTGGVLSRELLTKGGALTVELARPAILMTDLMIDDPAQLESALTVAIEKKYQSMVIIAQQVSGKVIGFLLANAEKFRTIAVKTPGGILNKSSALEDLSALVGGKLFLQSAGDQLEAVMAEDFGQARRLWADVE
jgi:chaperonin GroEL